MQGPGQAKSLPETWIVDKSNQSRFNRQMEWERRWRFVPTPGKAQKEQKKLNLFLYTCIEWNAEPVRVRASVRIKILRLREGGSGSFADSSFDLDLTID